MSPSVEGSAARKLVAEPRPGSPRSRLTAVKADDHRRFGWRRMSLSVSAFREQSNFGRIATLTAVALFVSVFGVVIFQTLIVQGQAHLDRVSIRIAAEKERSKDLTRQVADLESPDRIVAAARDRLGMISPTDVAYLTPAPGDDLLAAFTPPPSPATKPTTVKKAPSVATSKAPSTTIAPAAATKVPSAKTGTKTTATSKSSPTTVVAPAKKP
ncbi:MAG: septum formation initiator family protein [Actinomycetes bacterium]